MSCPICSKDVDKKYRPFCSKRCADVDLSKWMNGAYAVASVDRDDAEELATEHKKALEEDNTATRRKLH